jgi:hypothetical protein
LALAQALFWQLALTEASKALALALTEASQALKLLGRSDFRHKQGARRHRHEHPH